MAEVTVEDGNGSSLTFLDVDGFLFPKFSVDTIRGIRDIDIRPDDVIICAYPKSGTHWVWEMVRQLLALKDTVGHDQAQVSLQEKDVGMLELASQEELRMQPSPRVLNTHVYFEQLPQQVLTAGCRLVTLVRDPRDVAVSYYHHHRKLSDLYNYSGDWHHYLPLFLQGKLDYGSWFDYHLSWERGLLDHPELPVLSLSYETIKQDSVETVRQLSEFVGVQCDNEVLGAVSKACSFDLMKLTKGPMETDSTGQPIMYRKGVVGDWKSVFTVAQEEEFRKVYQAEIRDIQTLRSSASSGQPSGLPLAASYLVVDD